MGIIKITMSARQRKKKKREQEEDWIYDPIVVKGILRAEKEADEILSSKGHLTTMDELLERFHKEDAKKIQD